MTWNDIDAGGRVVLISEDFARQIAAEPADALGRRVRLDCCSDHAWREVFGVVQNIHEAGLYQGPPRMLYWPVFMEDLNVGTAEATFAIRSERAGSVCFVEEIRQGGRAVNGNVPVGQEPTMASLYFSSLARRSF